MIRPSGPIRNLLFALTIGGTSLLLGFGAVTATSVFGAPTDRDLGDAVVLDPSTVPTPTPTPTPGKLGTPSGQPTGGKQGTAGAAVPAPNRAPAPAPAPEHHPEQVVPVPPSSSDGEPHTRG